MNFHTKNVEVQYLDYKRTRVRRFQGLIVQLILWAIFTTAMVYQEFGDLKGIRIGIEFDEDKSSARMFYELPLFWLILLLIQFAFFYAETIPFLSKWQDYLERREFERLKNTYEYQLKLKDETTSNCHY